jgi:hypothetical protein
MKVLLPAHLDQRPFDHFVFHVSDFMGEHLPADIRGCQGELTAARGLA